MDITSSWPGSKSDAMSELEEIIAATGKKPVRCACDTCKNMCRKTPCIGTPTDILRIMNAGYMHKLQATLWMAGISFGCAPIHMITPELLDEGCSFLTDEGLCELHESGLKPIEGKLADHNGQNVSVQDLHKIISLQVAKRWLLGDTTTAKAITTGFIKWTRSQENKTIKNNTFYLPEKI